MGSLRGVTTTCGGLRDCLYEGGDLRVPFGPLLLRCSVGVAVVSLSWEVRLVLCLPPGCDRREEFTRGEEGSVIMSTRELVGPDAGLFCSRVGQKR